MADLIIQISAAKPQRTPLNQAFSGLKIAVSTHTTTTAVQMNDDDAPPAFTKTRTPARPDLPQRLANMRRDRAERKAAAAAAHAEPESIELPVHVGQRRRDGSDFSVEIEDEKADDGWRGGVSVFTVRGWRLFAYCLPTAVVSASPVLAGELVWVHGPLC